MIETQKFVQAMVANSNYRWSADYALGFLCASAHGWSRGLISGAQLMNDVKAIEATVEAMKVGAEAGFGHAAVLLSIADGISLEAAAALTPRPAGGEQPPRR